MTTYSFTVLFATVLCCVFVVATGRSTRRQDEVLEKDTTDNDDNLVDEPRFYMQSSSCNGCSNSGSSSCNGCSNSGSSCGGCSGGSSSGSFEDWITQQIQMLHGQSSSNCNGCSSSGSSSPNIQVIDLSASSGSSTSFGTGSYSLSGNGCSGSSGCNNGGSSCNGCSSSGSSCSGCSSSGSSGSNVQVINLGSGSGSGSSGSGIGYIRQRPRRRNGNRRNGNRRRNNNRRRRPGRYVIRVVR